ncbi:hypothetical protein ACLKA6_015876 [Drosophila palustris]
MLANVFNWHVSNEISMSDHQHIRFDIGVIVGTCPVTCNPRKTNWEHFTFELEQNVNYSNFPIRSIEELEYEATDVHNNIENAFKKSYIHKNRKSRQDVPWWNKTLEKKRKDFIGAVTFGRLRKSRFLVKNISHFWIAELIKAKESEFVNDRERVYISKAVVVDLTSLRNKNFSLAVLLFSSLCRESTLATHSVALDFGSSNFPLAATILGSDCPVPASTTGWQFVQRAVAGALSNSSVVRRALHSSGREAFVSYIKPEVVSYIKPASSSISSKSAHIRESCQFAATHQWLTIPFKKS